MAHFPALVRSPASVRPGASIYPRASLRSRVVFPLLSLLTVSTLAACGGGGGDSASANDSGGNGASVQRVDIVPADAARMAEQSSFGPTDTTITQIQQTGVDAYLQAQFNAPPSTYGDLLTRDVDPNSSVTCPSTGAPPNCFRDNYTAFPAQMKFYQNALTGVDQLRQRVALALSQILVISDEKIDGAYGFAQYQQMLLDDAFGNYRDILYKVTLHPVMGSYLDMVNNDKGTPNENYARELLQLFSIGLYQLNPDGTNKLDSAGDPLPTYDQDTIEGFAHAYTGWTYPARANAAPKAFFRPKYYVGPMAPSAANHDAGTKKLLNGTLLPAGQTPEKDIADAIDNIFNHPNVGPFIGKQLIQHLTTSNPSPAYVARVATAFANNGSGVRGDVKAVLRAILTDPEARGAAKTDANYGKLREPVLFMTGLLRVTGGRSDGVYLNARTAEMAQRVFDAPSVFNFYPPDYGLPGSDIVSPPTAIANATTMLKRINVANELLLGNGIAIDKSVSGATGTTIDWTALQALAADSKTLLDKLDLLMMHNTMPAPMRDSITAAVDAVDPANSLVRAKTAVYLVATSAQYAVEK